MAYKFKSDNQPKERHVYFAAWLTYDLELRWMKSSEGRLWRQSTHVHKVKINSATFWIGQIHGNQEEIGVHMDKYDALEIASLYSRGRVRTVEIDLGER